MSQFQELLSVAQLGFAKAEADLSSPDAKRYVETAFIAVNSARIDAMSRFVKGRTPSARAKAKADSERAKTLAEDISAAWQLVGGK